MPMQPDDALSSQQGESFKDANTPGFQIGRGPELRCRGWRQEGLLRMLENTLANGERPQDLVVYAGTGKVARNWDCFHAIVRALKTLADDETLVIQSGKPVAVFRTSERPGFWRRIRTSSGSSRRGSTFASSRAAVS